jgi:NADPH:quinone reductase-like Zn-dependent oxidoreductase
MSMRAFAVDEFGAAGSIHQLPIPEPGPGEILVTVHAAGVNVMDPLYVAGVMKEYMEHRFPLVPGIDFAGVVERVGGDVERFAAGDDVYGISSKPSAPAPSQSRSWSGPMAQPLSRRPSITPRQLRSHMSD